VLDGEARELRNAQRVVLEAKKLLNKAIKEKTPFETQKERATYARARRVYDKVSFKYL